MHRILCAEQEKEKLLVFLMIVFVLELGANANSRGMSIEKKIEFLESLTGTVVIEASIFFLLFILDN